MEKIKIKLRSRQRAIGTAVYADGTVKEFTVEQKNPQFSEIDWSKTTELNWGELTVTNYDSDRD